MPESMVDRVKTSYDWMDTRHEAIQEQLSGVEKNKQGGEHNYVLLGLGGVLN